MSSHAISLAILNESWTDSDLRGQVRKQVGLCGTEQT